MLFGIDSPKIRISKVIRIKIVKSFIFTVVLRMKVRIELSAIFTKLFPIKIVMRNFSSFFVKSYAILAKREELDLISSFILFALINAISLAEKKEERNNRINASQSSIVLSYYF
jgi:hypothetical protein